MIYVLLNSSCQRLRRFKCLRRSLLVWPSIHFSRNYNGTRRHPRELSTSSRHTWCCGSLHVLFLAMQRLLPARGRCDRKSLLVILAARPITLPTEAPRRTGMELQVSCATPTSQVCRMPAGPPAAGNQRCWRPSDRCPSESSSSRVSRELCPASQSRVYGLSTDPD